MFVTLRRPWRAHSELDGLSDAECRELIERRWRRHPPPFRRLGLVAALAGALAVPLGIVVFVMAFPIADDPEAEPAPIYILLSLALAVIAILAVMAVHWLLINILVRTTLHKLIAGAVCPRCRHPLRGLPIHDDAPRPEDQSRRRVRCPECGKVVRLLKYGYGPEDLASWEDRVLPKDFEVRVRE